MPKKPAKSSHAADADDALADRFMHMSDIALATATAAKGADLTDDEIEAILDLCGWYTLALAHGMDPVHCADAFRAEVRGTQTYH